MPPPRRVFPSLVPPLHRNQVLEDDQEGRRDAPAQLDGWGCRKSEESGQAKSRERERERERERLRNLNQFGEGERGITLSRSYREVDQISHLV